MLAVLQVSLPAKAQALPVHAIYSREPVMPTSWAGEAQEQSSLAGVGGGLWRQGWGPGHRAVNSHPASGAAGQLAQTAVPRAQYRWAQRCLPEPVLWCDRVIYLKLSFLALFVVPWTWASWNSFLLLSVENLDSPWGTWVSSLSPYMVTYSPSFKMTSIFLPQGFGTHYSLPCTSSSPEPPPPLHLLPITHSRVPIRTSSLSLKVTSSGRPFLPLPQPRLSPPIILFGCTVVFLPSTLSQL